MNLSQSMHHKASVSQTKLHSSKYSHVLSINVVASSISQNTTNVKIMKMRMSALHIESLFTHWGRCIILKS